MATIIINGSRVNHNYLLLLGDKPNPLQPHKVTIDGKTLDNPWPNIYLPLCADLSNGADWYFNGGTENQILRKNAVVFDLPNGTYTIIVGSGNFSVVTFTVTNGIIGYDHSIDKIVTGRGTNTLVLIGVTITIDANNLISKALYDVSLSRNFISRLTANFLPNWSTHKYTFIAASGLVADFAYNINIDGTVSFDTKYSGFASGNGTNTLIIKGYPLTIDARAIGYTSFWLNIINVPVSTNGLITGNFAPLRDTGYTMGAAISGNPGATVSPSHQNFSILANGDVIVSDPTILKVGSSTGGKTITLLKRLTQ